MKLTIFHDGQFWVGALEEVAEGKLKAVRYVFGSEPYDWDILSFVNHRMLSSISRANTSIDVKVPARPLNPKRIAREAAKEAKRTGMSTFAQEAIKKDFEVWKFERKIISKKLHQDLEKYKREVKVQKAKDKKRGH